MCAWYLLSGIVRLRRGPVVNASFGELRGDDFEITTTAAGPGTIAFRLRGDLEFTEPGADELDDLLRSLGRRAAGPTVLTGENDGERRVVPVDPADWPVPTPAGIPIVGIVPMSGDELDERRHHIRPEEG